LEPQKSVQICPHPRAKGDRTTAESTMQLAQGEKAQGEQSPKVQTWNAIPARYIAAFYEAEGILKRAVHGLGDHGAKDARTEWRGLCACS
jgi:hypothetical protein